MDKLTDRLRALDEVRPPELWEEIQRRPIPDRGPVRPGRQGLLTIVVALAAAFGGLMVAVQAFRDDGAPPRETPAPRVVQRVDPVTRAFVLDEERRVSCEVELPDGDLSPGELTLVSFSYRNEGTTDYVMGGAESPRLVITDLEGNPLYETQGIYNPKGLGFPRWLKPGETVRLYAPFAPIWAGPLRLAPQCWDGSGDAGEGDEEISSLVANVVAPGPPVSGADALARALARTGMLFDQCRPVSNGQPVDGTISAPGSAPDIPGYTYIDGDSATKIPGIEGATIQLSELEARCVVYIDENPGFTIVDLWFATPVDVPLPPPSWEIADAVRLPPGGRGQVGRWTLMVTAESVKPVSPHGLGKFGERGELGLMTVFRPPNDCNPVDLGGAGPVPPSCVLVSFRLVDDEWNAQANRIYRESLSSMPEPLIWFVGLAPVSPSPSP